MACNMWAAAVDVAACEERGILSMKDENSEISISYLVAACLHGWRRRARARGCGGMAAEKRRISTGSMTAVRRRRREWSAA